jgi:N-acetylglutamate synthase-like GNAT family acetyltransferase
MKKQITIRKATAKDVPAILELWKELMDFHKKLDPIFTRSSSGHKRFAEFLIQHINSSDSCAFVAMYGKNPVGFCLIRISNYPPALEKQQYGELTNIAVTKKYRQRGIGNKLVKKVRQWCAKKGVNRIEARYSTENPIATGFWARAGFRPYLKSTFLES